MPETPRQQLAISLDNKRLEKLMNPNSSNLVDINFLEVGLERARAVGKVENVLRAGQRGHGSGFLISGGWLITNNHVLQSADEARSARVVFNYQIGLNNDALPVRSYTFDPDNGFHTDPKHDWTAVRIKEELHTDERSLELTPMTVKPEDRVNVIQHPGGDYKKIAWNASPVVAVADGLVQYLTDTEEGSSGSPVFNKHWQVVALHHAGGDLKLAGSKDGFYCNEGIDINVVLEGLRTAGVV